MSLSMQRCNRYYTVRGSLRASYSVLCSVTSDRIGSRQKRTPFAEPAQRAAALIKRENNPPASTLMQMRSHAAMYSTMSAKAQFPPLHIIEPTGEHKHTVILLHGRGSSGPLFSDGFFASKTSGFDFRTRFPDTRWVFPSAPMRYEPAFKEERPAWFSIMSLTDLEVDQATQMDGLRESVEYISGLTKQEIAHLQRVGRDTKDLFVVARSMGSSVAVWTMLVKLPEVRQIGGVVLTGSWLVFARAIDELLGKNVRSPTHGTKPVHEDALGFVKTMLPTSTETESDESHPLRQVPILMGHSVDDQWISIDLGRQMRDVLANFGCEADLHEYVGAADDGHWMKEPEEMDKIASFLENCITNERG